MKRILFVCHGNICRSPMAEFILKSMVSSLGMEKSFHIESAAVSDEEEGNPIFPPARRCLDNHGIPYDLSKRARTVRPDDYEKFDRIICMDRSNLKLISGILGPDPMHKICLMMSYCGIQNDVADPWYTGNFETTYRDITSGCEAMLRQDI